MLNKEMLIPCYGEQGMGWKVIVRDLAGTGYADWGANSQKDIISFGGAPALKMIYTVDFTVDVVVPVNTGVIPLNSVLTRKDTGLTLTLSDVSGDTIFGSTPWGQVNFFKEEDIGKIIVVYYTPA